MSLAGVFFYFPFSGNPRLFFFFFCLANLSEGLTAEGAGITEVWETAPSCSFECFDGDFSFSGNPQINGKSTMGVCAGGIINC